MMTVPTFAEKLAVRLLAREGISAVWQLHVAAATAYRDGYKRAAETVLEIADAAERELLVRAHHS
jgi:aspartate aminotransferase-like enzyme